jgi:flagellar basal-body rod protein FlgG
MIEGLYAAASGMEAQQDRLDAISNDLANVNTTGYQEQRVGFEDLLYNSAGSGAQSGVTVGSGAAAVSLGPSQASGPISQTGQPLDLAIDGNAYFEVRQAGGSVALTRAGSFGLDASRQLTNAAGLIVQPPITVPAGTAESDVKIAADGTVSANGTSLGRIALVTVPAPEGLTQASGNLLLAGAASGAVRPATGATIQQGALNGSDVDLASEMTELVDAQNSYDLASRALNLQQQMIQTANEIKP